ncbi:MAG: ATP-binding protein [Hyphomicrobium sp.]
MLWLRTTLQSLKRDAVSEAGRPIVLALAATGVLLALLAAVNVVSAAAALAIFTAMTLIAAALKTWIAGLTRTLDPDVVALHEGTLAEPNWRDLVDSLHEPTLVLDPTRTITHHNAAARTLFGKAMTGLPLEYVNRDPELLRAAETVIGNGQPREVRIVTRLDSERHLIARFAPMPSAVLLTIRDLSDQHRLLEMRSDFIANASHELRTPLASVRGFIETLQGPARNDEVARTRFLGIMAAQAERMTRLIDDLLLLSRVEERAYLTPTGTVEINETVSHVVQTLQPLANDRQITVSLTPAPGRHSVAGERDELVQVFQNLIENAIKYGSTGGNVWITIAPNGGGAATANDAGAEAKRGARIAISVADDGPGIAPDHVPRLTERFYRVNIDQSRMVGGTGLGLAIVKHILTRHGGDLAVTSAVGKGSTFRVSLPLLPASNK